MNPELENLVDIALIDGYISDREKEVLKRKAVKLGFDVDELEMILEGKLYKLNNSRKPKVNKCPNCGEIVSGFSKVCPSCKYILTTEIVSNSDEEDDEEEDDESYFSGSGRSESLEDSFLELELSVHDLKRIPKMSSTKITNAVVKIILTGGLYIIYKKLYRKERLFDRYSDVNEKYISLSDIKAQSLLRKYGDDQKIASDVKKILANRDALIKKRQSADNVLGIALCLVGIVVVYFIWVVATLPKSPKKPETALEKTERLVKEKKIGEAKAAVAGIEEEESKATYMSMIRDLEVDSLVMAGNYEEALKLVNLMDTTGSFGDSERRDKMDEIITKQVISLLENREYKKAREKAKLANGMNSYNLIEKIDIAEKLNK